MSPGSIVWLPRLTPGIATAAPSSRRIAASSGLPANAVNFSSSPSSMVSDGQSTSTRSTSPSASAIAASAYITKLLPVPVARSSEAAFFAHSGSFSRKPFTSFSWRAWIIAFAFQFSRASRSRLGYLSETRKRHTVRTAARWKTYRPSQSRLRNASYLWTTASVASRASSTFSTCSLTRNCRLISSSPVSPSVRQNPLRSRPASSRSRSGRRGSPSSSSP